MAEDKHITEDEDTMMPDEERAHLKKLLER